MGNYIGSGLCALVGVVISGFALKRIIETVIFMRASHKTPGTVIGLATSRNSDRKTMYLPIVEFKSAGEKNVRFTSTVASNPPAYETGDKVEVRFLTKNPQAAKINSFSEIWALTLILAVVAVGCFFIAGAVFPSK